MQVEGTFGGRKDFQLLPLIYFQEDWPERLALKGSDVSLLCATQALTGQRIQWSSTGENDRHKEKGKTPMPPGFQLLRRSLWLPSQVWNNKRFVIFCDQGQRRDGSVEHQLCPILAV